MTEKKYYWLKFKENFFEQDEIKIIENMDNGKDYIIFLLKLQLKSIKTEGFLRFKDTIPYNEKMLSVITNTNIDVVRSALKAFMSLGMIERLDDGTLYMTEVQTLIGSESSSAERVRRFRENQKKALLCNGNEIFGNNTDAQSSTEIEIEKDIDIELDKDTNIEVENLAKLKIPYDEIKELWNKVCISYSKVTTLSNKRKDKIKQRWKELGSLGKVGELFGKVESSNFLKGNNSNQWKCTFDWIIENDNNYVKVLEGNYDNKTSHTTVSSKGKTSTFNNYHQRKYNFDELEAMALGHKEYNAEELTR